MVEPWRTRLVAGGPDDRIDALDDLRAAVRAKQALPYDELLDLLRTRAGFGDGAEPDRTVRDAIFHAKRAVAVARGRLRGLRHPAAEHQDELPDRSLVWNSIVIVWDAVSIY